MSKVVITHKIEQVADSNNKSKAVLLILWSDGFISWEYEKDGKA